ncbi:hypothetical protein MHU86_2203 [Fragilaria crotonensis]|nr:hypothetical protein MHU86_2203 [Fragilaria crotonensis]
MENCDRPSALGSATAIGTKTLEHAPPSDPMHSPGLRKLKSLENPAVVSANNHDVVPGAYPVRNTATSQASRPQSNGYAFTREFPNVESMQEDGETDMVRACTGMHDISLVDAERGFYFVEATPVPDGNEEGTMMVAEAQYVRMKWYQRPAYRWILVGSILFACGLVGAVVVLVVRPTSVASSASSTFPTLAPTTGSTGALPTTPQPTSASTSSASSMSPTTPQPTMAPTTAFPTSKPTSLTPRQIACNFLSIPNVTECRSTVKFDSGSSDDKTTGSTIPSEIGLLTQLTYLDFSNNALTSTIPSEIGLLTELTLLSFYINSLTSTIPSEIGLLTQLTGLDFFNNVLNSTIPRAIGRLQELQWMDFTGNELKGTIPSSLCSLPTLASAIFIDCGTITCASGCCSDRTDHSSCG